MLNCPSPQICSIRLLNPLYRYKLNLQHLQYSMGDVRQETWGHETEDGRQKTGDRRRETGDRRQETGDRRQETGDKRQERVLCTDRKKSAKFDILVNIC